MLFYFQHLLGQEKKGKTEDADLQQKISLTNELLKSRTNFVMLYFMDALWRNHILEHLLKDHNKLEKVRIINSDHKGEMCLEETKISNFQDLILSSFPTSTFFSKYGITTKIDRNTDDRSLHYICQHMIV